VIARNYLKHPAALARQLVLAFDADEATTQGIAKSVAALLRLLPCGSMLKSVPFIRKPAARRAAPRYRALDIPGMWWHKQLAIAA
jgi:hypothetical protein